MKHSTQLILFPLRNCTIGGGQELRRSATFIMARLNNHQVRGSGIVQLRTGNIMNRFSTLFTLTLLSGALAISTLTAAEPKIREQSFPSPDDAIKALQSATAAKDKPALRKIFGSEVDQLLTGDEVQDANNAAKFAAAMAEACHPVNEDDTRITLEVGTNNWPMPIPLVKTAGQWHFDTAAGKEEIINRHIGKDELHAIGVCRAYVTAQKQYADANPKVGGGAQYAQKFKSTPGKKDGLYWQSAEGEPASPFGPLVAEAHAEGYLSHGDKDKGPHPFHGYYFRILTAQGPAATGGKMSYLSEGVLAGGFALVAYPENWNQSGIMTFIVNQDGKVHQRDLGPNTTKIASDLKEYNPDPAWKLVPDEGVITAVTEK